jgi:hypothetical protein
MVQNIIEYLGKFSVIVSKVSKKYKIDVDELESIALETLLKNQEVNEALMYSILKNYCLNVIKKRKDMIEIEENTVAVVDKYDIFEFTEKERELILLRLEGFSCGQVQTVMGISRRERERLMNRIKLELMGG